MADRVELDVHWVKKRTRMIDGHVRTIYLHGKFTSSKSDLLFYVDGLRSPNTHQLCADDWHWHSALTDDITPFIDRRSLPFHPTSTRRQESPAFDNPRLCFANLALFLYVACNTYDAVVYWSDAAVPDDKTTTTEMRILWDVPTQTQLVNVSDCGELHIVGSYRHSLANTPNVSGSKFIHHTRI